jgi:hypothetical protein
MSVCVQAVGPVLRIINALVRDRGVYICTAENTAGSTVTSAIVEVERKWLEFSCGVLWDCYGVSVAVPTYVQTLVLVL